MYFAMALVTQFLRGMFLEVLRKRWNPLKIHTQKFKNEMFLQSVRSVHADHTVTACII